MAIKSSNIQGNPYHDEGTGQFTSANGGGNKIFAMMGGIEPNKSFDFKKGDVQKLVPQTNRDGTPRLFINQLSKEERDKQPIVLDKEGKILWIPGIKKSHFDRKKDKNYDIILRYD